MVLWVGKAGKGEGAVPVAAERGVARRAFRSAGQEPDEGNDRRNDGATVREAEGGRRLGQGFHDEGTDSKERPEASQRQRDGKPPPDSPKAR